MIAKFQGEPNFVPLYTSDSKLSEQGNDGERYGLRCSYNSGSSRSGDFHITVSDISGSGKYDIYKFHKQDSTQRKKTTLTSYFLSLISRFLSDNSQRDHPIFSCQQPFFGHAIDGHLARNNIPIAEMDRPSNSECHPIQNSLKQKSRLRVSPFCPCFSPTITDSDSDDESRVGEVNKVGIDWLWSPLEEVVQQRLIVTGEAANHTGQNMAQKTTVNRLYEATVHRIVEYSYHLVPDIDRILAASFYWGVMDRFRAEELLEGKPEGTFLLRDSAQSEYLFSVSFRRYQRTLHARIEQANHRFGFDILDKSVFSAPTVIQLMENYKDPSRCLFFEPQLTYPLHRDMVFSLQQLCRGVIVSHTTYAGVSYLRLPSKLKQYIKEYRYSIPVRTVSLSE